MTLREKIEFLEGIMDMDEGTLMEDAILKDIEEWDSLSVLSLMSEMKSKYGIRLESKTIKEFRTVADICQYIPD